MKNKQLTYGIHATIEALKSGQEIDKIFIQKQLKSTAIQEIEQLARQTHIPISFVPVQKLNKLTSENHQGVVANISPISFVNIEEMMENAFTQSEHPSFIVLDGITDVRNLGAIIRTAECTGTNGVILPQQGSAAINHQTLKTSAGAIFNVPICKVAHLKDAMYYLQSYQVQTVAATEKTEHSLYHIDLKKPTAIIMGSEGKGVSKALLNMVDHQAKLPISGEISSLNVSVACGVFLYEMLRQRMG